jgi:nitroreductase
MDFLKLAKKRRSVRDFNSRKVKDSDLGDIIDAARWAPSANNRQTWRFIVIRDKDIMKKVAKSCYGQSWMANASVLIVACSMPGVLKRQFADGERMAIQETSASVQNLLLAATEKGIATCWCGVSAHKGLNKLLSVPAEAEAEAVIALGYASNRRISPTQRLDVHDVMFYNSWGALDVDYTKSKIGEHTKPLLERKTVNDFKSSAKKLRSKFQVKK